MTGAGDADHRFLAVTAKQLAGEKIQTAFPSPPLGRAAGGILPGILLQITDGLDFIKECLGNDGRNPAGNDDIPVVIQAGITFIAEDPVEAGFVPLLALLRGDAAGIQIPDDVSQSFVLPNAVEDLPDDFCLRLFDSIAAILSADIAQGKGTIDHAFTGVVIHAALYLSAQLLGVVFGQTFQKGFHEDTGGIIGDILHGGENLDACVLQLPFVHGTVVPVPGEAVKGIDNNIFPVADFCILDHPLEAGALVAGTGEGAVFVHMDNTQSVAVSEFFTGPDLLLDGNIPLGMAGIPGIDHGIPIFILGNVSHNYLAFLRGVFLFKLV